MKLYLNDTSPFSRAVVITAAITGHQPFQLEWVDPWVSPSELLAVNPFCLIPTLQLTDGQCLSESLCICRYLIENGNGGLVTDVNYQASSQVAMLGLAKTMMEVAFRSVALGRFIDQDNAWSQRGSDGLDQAITQLNAELTSQISQPITANLANLYLHVALEYVQFRHPSIYQQQPTDVIDQWQALSPFKAILEQISLDWLATKPDSLQIDE